MTPGGSRARAAVAPLGEMTTGEGEAWRAAFRAGWAAAREAAALVAEEWRGMSFTRDGEPCDAGLTEVAGHIRSMEAPHD